MFAEYLAKAAEKADYEKMENGHFFATIPGFQGLWAEGTSVESARRELLDALESWLLLGIRFGDELPVVGGINLNKIGHHAKTRKSA
jgi:predicted RNase H-like HicB family nuclease